MRSTCPRGSLRRERADAGGPGETRAGFVAPLGQVEHRGPHRRPLRNTKWAQRSSGHSTRRCIHSGSGFGVDVTELRDEPSPPPASDEAQYLFALAAAMLGSQTFAEMETGDDVGTRIGQVVPYQPGPKRLPVIAIPRIGRLTPC